MKKIQIIKFLLLLINFIFILFIPTTNISGGGGDAYLPDFYKIKWNDDKIIYFSQSFSDTYSKFIYNNNKIIKSSYFKTEGLPLHVTKTIFFIKDNKLKNKECYKNDVLSYNVKYVYSKDKLIEENLYKDKLLKIKIKYKWGENKLIQKLKYYYRYKNKKRKETLISIYRYIDKGDYLEVIYNNSKTFYNYNGHYLDLYYKLRFNKEGHLVNLNDWEIKYDKKNKFNIEVPPAKNSEYSEGLNAIGYDYALKEINRMHGWGFFRTVFFTIDVNKYFILRNDILSGGLTGYDGIY